MKASATIATNATNQGIVDCAGYHYAKVMVIGGIASSGTSNTFSTLALQEGDTTAITGTNQANVTGAVGGTDATSGFTIPINNSSVTGYLVEFNVDLRKRKRYLTVKSTPSIVASDMGPYSVVAVLSRAEVSPSATADAISLVSTTGVSSATTYARVVV